MQIIMHLKAAVRVEAPLLTVMTFPCAPAAADALLSEEEKARRDREAQNK
jgi:hypothetical protein